MSTESSSTEAQTPSTCDLQPRLSELFKIPSLRQKFWCLEFEQSLARGESRGIDRPAFVQNFNVFRVIILTTIKITVKVCEQHIVL